MDGFGTMLLVLLGASVLGGVITTVTLMPGQSLAGKFRELGNMTGKTQAEIIASVGPPNSVSTLAGGQLLQWQATGYHIAIMFKDGIFAGITHEHAARQ